MRRVPRGLGCLAASLLAGAVLAQEPGEGRPSEKADASKLRDELRAAAAGGQVERALEVIGDLVATGDPKAVDAIAQHAITGASHELEKRAAGILAGTKEPKVRARVLESLGSGRSPNFKARIVFLAVAAAWADAPPALDAIHGALRDPHKAVVLTALERIRGLKRKESVEPLLAAYEEREKRPRDRVYHDMQRTLRDLTGVELEASIDFRNFWEGQKTGQVAAGQVIKPRSDGVTSVHRGASFFSLAVATDRVLFVIDISKSLEERDPLEIVEAKPKKKEDDPGQGTTVVAKKPEKPKPAPKPQPPPASRERLFRVKEELVRTINALPAGTRFGILSFSHEIAWWGTERSLRDSNAASKADAVRWVRGLSANGATRTDLALEAALGVPDVDTVYLLTDGAPKDERNQRLEIEPILEKAKSWNRFLRCRIHTISFAQIRDRRMRTFVREVAAQNDGVCHMLP
ncbi:MAG: VWA domain-containing protein [Planctomycetes bacterium]|nr:VWA domain-containing protein [Planctomycetota bacterium]